MNKDMLILSILKDLENTLGTIAGILVLTDLFRSCLGL